MVARRRPRQNAATGNLRPLPRRRADIRHRRKIREATAPNRHTLRRQCVPRRQPQPESLILYDATKPGELNTTKEFGAGTPAMFPEASSGGSNAHSTTRALLKPGKVFPTLHRFAELGRVHVHAGKVAFPDMPRF